MFIYNRQINLTGMVIDNRQVNLTGMVIDNRQVQELTRVRSKEGLRSLGT